MYRDEAIRADLSGPLSGQAGKTLELARPARGGLRSLRAKAALSDNPRSKARPKTVALMGVRIDCLTETEVVERIIFDVKRGLGGWVVTPNVDQLRIVHEQPKLRETLKEASLVVADGMPLVWASRLQKTPLPERVAGSSLILSLSAAAARSGARLFLLGGFPGAGRAAAAVLQRHNPALQIGGVVCPPMGFDRNPAELSAVREALTRAQPDIVYCCFGFPKQERIILDLKKELPSAWFLGLGGSFSIIGGQVSRAPTWVQSIGLEWTWRLVMEPKRLFRRYIVHDLPFATRLICSALRQRARERARMKLDPARSQHML